MSLTVCDLANGQSRMWSQAQGGPFDRLEYFSSDGSDYFPPKHKNRGGQKPGVPREPSRTDRLERGHQVSVFCNKLGSSMMSDSLYKEGEGI